MKNFLWICFTGFVFYTCQQPPQSNTIMDIENKKWVLYELNGKKIEVDSSKVPFLKLDNQTGKIDGTGGCNSFSGAYKLKESNISFSSMISTERFCEDHMNTERAFFKALAETKTISASKDNKTLSLYSESKTTLAQLKSE